MLFRSRLMFSTTPALRELALNGKVVINLSTAPPTNIELFERSFLSKLVSFSTSAQTISLSLDTSFSAFFKALRGFGGTVHQSQKTRMSTFGGRRSGPGV